MGGRFSKPASPSPAGPISLREAGKHDLDAITDIVRAGFPDDPGCDYKYPYRDKYPEDFWKWTKRQYEEYMDQPEKFAVLVATQPVTAADTWGWVTGGGRRRATPDIAVAYAVWDIAVAMTPKGGGICSPCS